MVPGLDFLPACCVFPFVMIMICFPLCRTGGREGRRRRGKEEGRAGGTFKGRGRRGGGRKEWREMRRRGRGKRHTDRLGKRS